MLGIDSVESRGIVLAMSDGMFCAGMCWHQAVDRWFCCWCGVRALPGTVIETDRHLNPLSSFKTYHGHYAMPVDDVRPTNLSDVPVEQFKPIVWRSIESIPPPPPEPARCRHGKTGPCWDDPPLSIGVNQ